MTLNFTFRSNRLVFIKLQIFFLQPSVTFLGFLSNKLMLNPSKTEFLLIGTSQQRKKHSDVTSISLDNTTIPVGTSARNLGFIIDSDMSLTSQVNLVCKSSHFHIRNIRCIRILIPSFVAITLANSLVSSRLDYCNSLYFGMSKQYKILLLGPSHKLQSISMSLQFSKIFIGSLSLNGLSIKFSSHQNHHEWPALLFASVAYTSDTLLINQIISDFCSFHSKNQNIDWYVRFLCCCSKEMELTACCCTHNNLCFFFSI